MELERLNERAHRYNQRVVLVCAPYQKPPRLAIMSDEDGEVVTADENFFRNMDEIMATQPAVNRMRWQQLRPKFADFAANAHGIIRADKSGNAVLEEIHAHR